MSKSVVKKNDILVMSVLHMESAGNCSNANKPKLFIKMESRMVCGNNRVELHKFKTKLRGFFKRMGNYCFTDMSVAKVCSYSIACVCNMAASSDVVGMQNIKTDGFAGICIKSDSGEILRFKKLFCFFYRKGFELRKSDAVFNNSVPDCSGISRIGF